MHKTNIPNQPTKILAVWVGLILFAIYLLSFSGRFHVMDELAVFTAGHNFAQYGQADINPLIWTNHWTPHPPGIMSGDGNLYTKKAPGISFLVAPLVIIGHAVPKLNTIHLGLLTNSIITAMTASLLVIWLSDLGYSPKIAMFTSLGYGLCTIAWIYARMLWGLTVLGLLILIAVWAVYRAETVQKISRSWMIFLAGLAAALGPAFRFESAVIIIFIGVYLFQKLNFSKKFPFLLIYGMPSLLVGMGLLYFNYIRFVNLGETGYSQEIMFHAPWTGAYSMLFSPGQGLFFYSPFMLLIFFGMRATWQRLDRSYFLLIATICLFNWLFYSSWFAWGGIWNWGPRFLLPILPLMMVFVAEALQALSAYRLMRWGTWLLASISIMFNIFGMIVDFNEYFAHIESNEAFIFDIANFPPLANWRIFLEGYPLDFMWYQAQHGFPLQLHILCPPLIILIFAAVNLIAMMKHTKQISHQSETATWYMSLWIALPLTCYLTLQMMWGTAHIESSHPQAIADMPMIETLSTTAQNGDMLFVTLPPYSDVQEFSTRSMAYQDQPLPMFIWIEEGSRSIKSDERQQVWQNAMSNATRLWYFERWHNITDGLTLTARHLNQTAFLLEDMTYADSGKLSLYAIANTKPHAGQVSRLSETIIPVNIPFEFGITLLDFSLFNNTFFANDILKLRLTWQTATAQLPPKATIVFIQVLAESDPTQNVSQSDRLLIDMQNPHQSPLLPGQTMSQGYALYLPADISAGQYMIIVGLYDAKTLQRLKRADGSPDDFLYLTTVILNTGMK